MKKLQLSIIFLALFTLGLFSQQHRSVEGIWLGTLKLEAMQNMELRLGFTFTESAEGKLEALMTSIDQGRTEVPMDVVKLNGDTLLVQHHAAGIRITGVFNPDKKIWQTEFSQGPVVSPLLFNKVDKLPE